MRYFRRFFAFLLIIFLLTGSFCQVFADEAEKVQTDATVTQGCHSIDAASAFLGTAKLSDNIETAILYEMNSDTLMYAWNPDTAIYPSSLVKILTALIAVERGDTQAVITVDQESLDAVPYYAASAELVAGEQMSLRDLLYCMMVGSANDAAAVIATHISGSINAFVNDMNAYAKQLGCTATQFTNVHGLHDENQYTTARDMSRILAAAVRNADFLTYFSEITYNVPATNMSEERELSSGNFLMNTDNLQLYFDPRATGGRTGIAEDGSRCLATLAEKNGMQVICIVTGSESTFAENGGTLTYGSFKETSTLLDACFSGYQVAQILYEGQSLVQYPVINGENDVILCADSSVYAVLPEGVTMTDLSFRYTDLSGQITAPVEAGQVLSDVQVWHNGFCVAQAGMTAMNTVRNIPVVIEESDDDNTVRTVLITIASVAGVIVVIVLLIRGARMIRFFNRNRRKNQYKRSRRRSR